MEKDNLYQERTSALADFLAAWNSKDADKLLALLSDSVEWVYLLGEAPLTNKSEVREMIEKIMETYIKSAQRWWVHVADTKNVFIAEGIDDAFSYDGIHIQQPMTTVFEFEPQSAKICKWRDYYNQNLFHRIMKQEELPDVVAPLGTKRWN